MSAIALYVVLALVIWLDLLIKYKIAITKVHWATSFLISLGWPIWVFGACQVLYLQVSTLTKEQERNEANT